MKKLLIILLFLFPVIAFAALPGQKNLLFWDGSNFNSTSSPTIGYLNATSTTASSTFANGLNLTGGCYQLNGSCLINGVLSAGPLGSLQFSNGSGGFGASGNLFWSTTKNAVGIGTTTPFWGLTISANSPTTPTLGLSDFNAATNQKHWVFSSIGGNMYIGTSSDVFGTSTPSALTILNNGNIGVSTSSPGTIFSIGNTVNFTTGTSTFSSTGGLNLTAGCYGLLGSCIGVNAGTAGQAAYYASAGSVVSATSTIFISNGSAVGIGTTSPAWNLQVAGTQPSISLSDMSATVNQKHWVESNQGGNIYFATATDALATSSPPAIVIQGTGPAFFAIGTSSPGAIQQPKANLILGPDPVPNAASSTEEMASKISQFNMKSTAGTLFCVFINASGNLVANPGPCN